MRGVFKHWAVPGVYLDSKSLNEGRPIAPSPANGFNAGDIVRCVKTFVPSYPDVAGHITREGEIFTVRVYLISHEYLILEEIGWFGFQNAARFEVLDASRSVTESDQ